VPDCLIRPREFYHSNALRLGLSVAAEVLGSREPRDHTSAAYDMTIHRSAPAHA
jgi:hypothetical protein